MQSTALVRTEHLNHYGRLFGGQLLRWVDEFAWIAATRDFPASRFVTRAMDKVEFRHQVKNGEIILSWGEKPTGGYVITIEETAIEEGDLYVYYSLRSPGPDEMVSQALTYPEDSAEIPGEFEEVHLVYNKN